MRIAWLVHQYPPEHLGGTEVYTHGLARRALADGHDALVLTYREAKSIDPRDHAPAEREHEGVRVVDLPYNLWGAPSRARYEYDNPELGARVRALLEGFRPHVVHCTHAMKLSTSALDACAELGVPVVVTLCDYWFMCPRHTLLTSDGELCNGPDSWRKCFRCTHALHGIEPSPVEEEAVRRRPAHVRAALGRARRIVALSSFQKDLFARHGVDRVEVIPHGLELDALEARRSGARAPAARLAFVGSLVPHKGAHVALAALRARPDLTDVELVVHGATRPGDAYGEGLVRQAAADDRVTLAGQFPPERLGSVLGEADFLVFPALWYENDPLVVKAALHLGVPCIVSRIGSLVEMVSGEADGWTVEPGDVEAWGHAFARAAGLPGHAARRPTSQPSADDHYRSLARIYAEEAVA